MNVRPQMTWHAAVRKQQRCIPKLIIDWLQRYGAAEYSNGAQVRFFDKAAQRRLASDVGQPVIDALRQYMNAYLVEGEGESVVTVGYRYRRVRRS